MKSSGAGATTPDLFTASAPAPALEGEARLRETREDRAGRILRVPLQVPLAQAAARLMLEQYRPDRNSPESLARLMVLVPTRRAVRALREALLVESAGEPLLLPRIQPIGEAAEDEAAFAQLLSDPIAAEAVLSLPPAMEEVERQFRMTQLLRAVERDMPLEQVASLALSLLEVIDDCQRHGCQPESLTGVVPEALAGHWQKVLQVLQVIWTHWPGVVAEAGKLDPIDRRNRMLETLAGFWQRQGSPHPVLAVGTLGSQQQSIALLNAVLHLPQGRLVLPAVDAGMQVDAWEAAGPMHHAYHFRRMLEHFGLTREELPPIGQGMGRLSAVAPRAVLLQEAMLPAELTDQWREPRLHGWEVEEAQKGLRLVEATSTAQEAQSIALLLRESLETAGRTAALVTPDRDLAEQVKAALARFGVAVDDSAGTPLLRTPLGRFFQEAMDAVSAGLPPVALLALLKHPLCRMGQERGAWLARVRQFERACLHGIRPPFGPAGLRAVLSHAKEAVHAELAPWLERLIEALQPLHAALHIPASGMGLIEVMKAHLELLERLSTDEAGEVLFWQQPESATLLAQLESMQRHAALLPTATPQDYPPLMVVMLAGVAWRPAFGTHPRLHILSPQEARMQVYDLVILGGLNENSWPRRPDAGPWMSRPMRASAGLNPMNEEIGVQALDFFLQANLPNVVMTYATRQGGAAAEASRFVQRLQAVLLAYAQSGAPFDIRAPHWAQWAEALNHWDGPIQPAPRPAPAPPLRARPRKLSVTDIDRLKANPYAVYARRVLQLSVPKVIDMQPEARDWGNMVHKVLQHLATAPGEGAALERAYWELVEKEMRAWAHFPLLQTYARAEMARLAGWFLPLEEARRRETLEIKPEQEMTLRWPAPGGEFALTARIDRAELLPGGGLRLIDYKTGSLPGKNEMLHGTSNQMPLQGWMVAQGAWPGYHLEGIEFWQLAEDEAETAVKHLEDIVKSDVAALFAEAGARLQAMIATYDQDTTPYLAHPAPAKLRHKDDYAHLAREGEWEE